jgi:D-alanyl-lipoteichoic acid acyltransferase DltB (MBOAT superfamily)
MLFNSITFLCFLPLVFLLYWRVFDKSLKTQNALILFSSYFFYGWWDWRFLSLILFSSLFDFLITQKIVENKRKSIKKFLLFSSIITNLGLLVAFKYFNFFIESFNSLLYALGYENLDSWTLKIILPVGISFYTFQTLSYTIDVYLKKLTPTKDFISFAAFVSFFPQLVAGPIERASNLLPQLQNKRVFNYKDSVIGMRLILWGFFKKVVIADSLAPFVNDIFTNYYLYDGGTLILGAIFFAFQIYCDFSGYSDIAIGTAALFGIRLMTNFKMPYFSRNIAEFWRRWHISLSSWFRDYLYIPIGGSRISKIISIRNVFIVFLVSGFWHGANFTFLAWGFIHALLFIPSFITGNNKKYINNSNNYSRSLLNKIAEPFLIIKTFFLVTFAWIFFRSDSISNAASYIYSINSKFTFEYDNILYPIFIVICLLSLEFFFHKFYNLYVFLFLKKKFLRRLIYILTFLIIIMLIFQSKNESFIYFQF